MNWRQSWVPEAAWHTGSVPQQRRRAENGLLRKHDPACRLLPSSTDSGSASDLNLQVASAACERRPTFGTCPAKLEQRIARAWRKTKRVR